jgi:hypothetical protein
VTIALNDFTWRWREALPQVVANWNGALAAAGREFALVYTPRELRPCEAVEAEAGTISACDSIPQTDIRLGEGGWDGWGSTWVDGYTTFFADPVPLAFGLEIGAHEVGHALQLEHGTGDTVMTPVPSRAVPTAADALAALPGYPYPPPGSCETCPVPPPPPERHDRQDQPKRRKRKRH